MPTASFVVVVLLAALQVPNAVVVDGTEWFEWLAITTYETEPVNSTSADNVSFVKYATVNALAETPAVSKLFFSLPGRVFVDYVDYKDGGELVNSSTLMQIKASGDVFDLVDQFLVDSDSWGGVDEASVRLDMFYSNYLYNASAPGHLLVEVSVFRPKSVRTFYSSDLRKRSLEIIVSDCVTYSRDDSPQFSADSSGHVDYAGPSSGSGAFENDNDTLHIMLYDATNLYLSSTSTPLNLHDVYMSVSESPNLYSDGSALSTSSEVAISMSNDTSVIAFFDSVQTDSVRFTTGEGGTLCFAVSDSLETGSYNYLPDTTGIALPGETGGLDVSGTFTCVKAQVPDCVPRDISLPYVNLTAVDGAASSVSTNALIRDGSSSTGSGSGASPSPSSSQDNGVSRPKYACVVAMAALVAFQLSVQ